VKDVYEFNHNSLGRIESRLKLVQGIKIYLNDFLALWLFSISKDKTDGRRKGEFTVKKHAPLTARNCISHKRKLKQITTGNFKTRISTNLSAALQFVGVTLLRQLNVFAKSAPVFSMVS